MIFKTVSVKDPEFHSYLNQCHGLGWRVRPLHSLNDGLKKRAVTFEIEDLSLKPLEGISFSRHLTTFAQSFRLSDWVLVLLPLWVYLTICDLDGYSWSFAKVWLVFLGVLSSFVGLSQMSDSFDYKKGWDRFKPQQYSVLTRGEMSLKALEKQAFILLGFSLILSFYSLWFVSSFLLIFLLIVGVLLFFWVQPPWEFKYRFAGEWIFYLFFGPLLLWGYSFFIKDLQR
jgi:1,4-dihydroxy-2-naphthoate octaprenyltransferase